MIEKEPAIDPPEDDWVDEETEDLIERNRELWDRDPYK
jgi:hypothetical protein